MSQPFPPSYSRYNFSPISHHPLIPFPPTPAPSPSNTPPPSPTTTPPPTSAPSTPSPSPDTASSSTGSTQTTSVRHVTFADGLSSKSSMGEKRNSIYRQGYAKRVYPGREWSCSVVEGWASEGKEREVDGEGGDGEIEEKKEKKVRWGDGVN